MDRTQIITPALIAFAAASTIALAAAGNPFSVRIVSGTPQIVKAWVAARADRYESDFPNALTVKAGKRVEKVRFRCITKGCTFPPADLPDSVSRVDDRTFDVRVSKGIAAIKLTIWTVTPEPLVVTAQPSDRANPRVRFILNAR